MTADMSANGDEDGIEAAGLAFREDVLDLSVALDPYAYFLDAVDLPHKIGTGQPIGRDAEMHHAAGNWSGFLDFDRMPQSCQVIRRR